MFVSFDIFSIKAIPFCIFRFNIRHTTYIHMCNAKGFPLKWLWRNENTPQFSWFILCACVRWECFFWSGGRFYKEASNGINTWAEIVYDDALWAQNLIKLLVFPWTKNLTINFHSLTQLYLSILKKQKKK